MTVARNIEALMEQRQLDAAKLARRAGLNPTGIYDILKGKSRSPKIETIGKIAKGLGVPIAVIFSDRVPEVEPADLLGIYDQLSPEAQKRLFQAAQAWLEDPAA